MVIFRSTAFFFINLIRILHLVCSWNKSLIFNKTVVVSDWSIILVIIFVLTWRSSFKPHFSSLIWIHVRWIDCWETICRYILSSCRNDSWINRILLLVDHTVFFSNWQEITCWYIVGNTLRKQALQIWISPRKAVFLMTIFPELLFLSFAIRKLLIGSVCAIAEHFDLFKLFHFVELSCVWSFTLDCVHCNIFEDTIDSIKGILVSESRLTCGGHSRPSITFWTKQYLNLLLFRLVDIVALFIVVLGILDEESSNILVVLRHLIIIFVLAAQEFSFRYLMFG